MLKLFIKNAKWLLVIQAVLAGVVVTLKGLGYTNLPYDTILEALLGTSTLTAGVALPPKAVQEVHNG